MDHTQGHPLMGNIFSSSQKRKARKQWQKGVDDKFLSQALSLTMLRDICTSQALVNAVLQKTCNVQSVKLKEMQGRLEEAEDDWLSKSRQLYLLEKQLRYMESKVVSLCSSERSSFQMIETILTKLKSCSKQSKAFYMVLQSLESFCESVTNQMDNGGAVLTGFEDNVNELKNRIILSVAREHKESLKSMLQEVNKFKKDKEFLLDVSDEHLKINVRSSESHDNCDDTIKDDNPLRAV